MSARPWGGLVVATLLLCFPACMRCSAAGAAVVELDTLIRRAWEHDPAIERLRGMGAESMALIPRAMPMQNPEVRVRYGRTEPGAGAELADTDSYAFELRAFPRHPLLRQARERHAQTQANLQQTALETALFQIEIEIRAEFLDAWDSRILLRWEERAFLLARREQALNEELFRAGQLQIDEVDRGRVRLLEREMRIQETRALLRRLEGRLRMRGRLQEKEEIRYPADILSIVEPMDSLDPDMLVPLAMARSTSLQRILLEREQTDAERAGQRAGRVPWPSLFSVSYHVDERSGRPHQDEYRILAGVEVPLSDWFDRQASRPIEARAASLERQQRLDASLLSERVRRAMIDLQEARQRADVVAARIHGIQREIRPRIEQLSGDSGLAARRQENALYRLLILLRQREHAGHAEAARLQLALQALLGPGSMEGRNAPEWP